MINKLLLDSVQFADACGADLTNSTMVQVFVDVVSDSKLTTFKGIVLIMPAVILAFVALLCTLLIRRSRSSNVVPFIGTFSSIFGFFAAAAGLALVIVTFWKGLATLERRVEGLSHQWGPAIYLVGIGGGCLLIALVCFVISLFTNSSDNHKRETFHLYDYDLNNNKDSHIVANTPTPYDATTHLNSPTKHDSYNDYNSHNQAATTPTTQHYPSYHQYQQQPYQQQNTYQQTTYQQQNYGGGGNYY
jgi:hypothetical protein